jgi:hypothetical protein
MAVKVSEIKAKVGEPVLNEKELASISIVEKYIDDYINANFDNESMGFDINIVQFRKTLSRGHNINFKDTRKKLMTKELERRFSEAEWRITIDHDSIYNTWILSPK